MFWLLYSPPPTDPAFDNVNFFISGGVGRAWGEAQQRPLMLCWNDKHLQKEPVEHRINRVSWFQQEYMHFVNNPLFPEFKLEVPTHSYCDRSTWADDFGGRFKQD